jgi:uncharacterized protein
MSLFSKRLTRLTTAAAAPEDLAPDAGKAGPEDWSRLPLPTLEPGSLGAQLARLRTPTGERRGVAGPLPVVSTETALGTLHTRRIAFGATDCVGHAQIAAGHRASAELLALLASDASLADLDVRKALYFDTETTGLSGGTGTLPFLVGIGSFVAGGDEASGFEMVQWLLQRPGEERPILAAFAERMAEASMLVSFNGKSFDWPLLRTRYAIHQMACPTPPPHLDLLHVARRVHRYAGRSSKLTALERDVLGFERIDDVPSSEVSACYFHFLRTGQTDGLVSVLEHNGWDIVTMAALLGLYGEPLAQSRLSGGELASVAAHVGKGARKSTVQQGIAEEALMAAEGALRRDCQRTPAVFHKVRGDLAQLREDRDRALQAYQEGLDEALSEGVIEAAEPKKMAKALRLARAKLYEHHVKDFGRAHALAALGTGESPEAEARRQTRLASKCKPQAKQQKSRRYRSVDAKVQGSLFAWDEPEPQ